MKALNLIGVFAAASVVAIALTVQPAYGQLSYGESCNQTNLCNDQLGLSCQTGSKCGCQRGNFAYSSFWDSAAKTCFLTTHPNVTCQPVADTGAPAIPCTQNSKCRKDGSNYRCFCDYPFVTGEDMFFKCYAPYGANCSNAECIDGQGLICGADKSCQCRQGTHYDTTNGCVIKIGDRCGMDGESLSCAGGSNCTNNVCTCNSGFDPSADMLRCVKKPGDPCANDQECPDTFTCNNITTTSRNDATFFDATVTALQCSCKDGEIHVNGSNVCRVKAGSPCETGTGNECVLNAICSANKTCECDSNYKDVNGLCKGFWSAPCSENGDCAEDDFWGCDSTLKKCECKSGYTVNSTNRVCVGVVGSACKNDDNCQHTGATCSNNVCACASDFRDDNGTCFGSYGAACNVDLPCFKESHLTCYSSFCGCNSALEIWDTANSNNATCAIKPMQLCGNANDRPCTTNSTCRADDNQDLKCMCMDGMEPNDNSTACTNSAAAINLFRFLLLLPLYAAIKLW